MVEDVIRDTGLSVNVNSTVRNEDPKTSRHGQSKAVDIDKVEGDRVREAGTSKNVMGNVQKLQKAFDEHGNIRENFGPAFKHKTFENGKRNDNWPAGGHQEHVHTSAQ